MSYYTDNPVRDAERHQADQDRELERLPVCCFCDNPIQNEHFYEINGEAICPDCLENYFKRRTGDYIE